jgi:hypothetical protein
MVLLKIQFYVFLDVLIFTAAPISNLRISKLLSFFICCSDLFYLLIVGVEG